MARYQVSWRSYQTGGTKTKNFGSYSATMNFIEWASNKLNHLKLENLDTGKYYKIK